MDPFVAEIRMFAFDFLVPRGWALCNGQLMPISQNTALFSLVGTYYGGDGKSTFALPDMRDNVPVHTGFDQGPGLTPRVLGETGGAPFVTLIQSEMPVHTHNLMAAPNPALVKLPSPNVALARSKNGNAYDAVNNANSVPLDPNAIAPTGGSLPHNNMQPFLAVSFCIALQGVFPARH
jgi:microcystin-dependent protein